MVLLLKARELTIHENQRERPLFPRLAESS